VKKELGQLEWKFIYWRPEPELLAKALFPAHVQFPCNSNIQSSDKTSRISQSAQLNPHATHSQPSQLIPRSVVKSSPPPYLLGTGTRATSCKGNNQLSQARVPSEKPYREKYFQRLPPCCTMNHSPITVDEVHDSIVVFLYE
jgi:hypothetical protein